MNLYQGGVEDIFLESMRNMGLEVQRATMPTSIEFTSDDVIMDDSFEHVVKVSP